MLVFALAECYSCIPACAALGVLASIRHAEYDAEQRAKAKRRKLQQQVEELDAVKIQLKAGLKEANLRRAELMRQLAASEHGATFLKNAQDAGHLDSISEAALRNELENSHNGVTSWPTASRGDPKMGLRIKGFESAMQGGGTDTPKSIGSSKSGTRSVRSQEIIDDLSRRNQELADELSKLRNQTPRSGSARSDRSSGARSDKSQRIIDELQAQIEKLQEDKGKSAEVDDLLRQNQELMDQLSKIRNQTPRSAQSGSSVRSDKSQRIIDELQAQIKQLQEEKGKHSEVEDLLRKNQELTDQLVKTRSRTPRSMRSDRSGNSSAPSDRSQRIIDELQAQIQKLQEDKGDYPGLGGHIEPLLKRLQMPECGPILAREGIEYLDDLEDYTEGELVEIGFKRAHAKRLLKAVAVQTAPDDANFPTPVASCRGVANDTVVEDGSEARET